MINLIRSDLLQFCSYSTARDEAKNGSIWMNANESPFLYDHFGIHLNRYPEKQPEKIVNRIAEIFSIKSGQVAITRGSDEAIDLLIRLFCVAGKDGIMICSPTYGVYSIYAKLQGAHVKEVPLLKQNNFTLNIELINNNWDESIKLIFLCSPNNPTGNIFSVESILSLCKKYENKSIIVVDEAYIDFSDSPTLIPLSNSFKNLVILRTASKAYGLAGLRFGFVVANNELINWILKIIAPYPLSSLHSHVALEAFSEARLLNIKEQIKQIKIERDRLYQNLSKLPCVSRIWASEGNFLLLETNYLEKIITETQKAGIVIRKMFDKFGLENCLRISVGLPDENETFLKVLETIG